MAFATTVADVKPLPADEEEAGKPRATWDGDKPTELSKKNAWEVMKSTVPWLYPFIEPEL